MEIYGYKKCYLYRILTWIAILGSGFLLRLVFFWRPQWMLYFTYRRCPLDKAEKVLLIDKYNQYFVESVYTLDGAPDLSKLLARGSYYKHQQQQDSDEILKCPDSCFDETIQDPIDRTYGSIISRTQQQQNPQHDWIQGKRKRTLSSRSNKSTLTDDSSCCLESDFITNNKLDGAETIAETPIDEQNNKFDDKTPITCPEADQNENEGHVMVYFSNFDKQQDAQKPSGFSVRYFDNKKIRFVWDEASNNFVKLYGFDKNITFNKLRIMTDGLSGKERVTRHRLYGDNAINVEVQPYHEIMLTEVLGPFYIFQLFSFIVWLVEDYMYYGVCIIIMSITSLVSGVIQIRRNQEQLRAKVESDDYIKVLRNNDNTYEEIKTSELVPGDIVAVPTFNTVLQFDGVLINGNVIVNESMLTGESVPVTKTPLPLKDKLKPGSQEQIYYDEKEHGKHTLFSGTTILQTRYYSGLHVKALVIRTGYHTTKGELIRSIMFPKPVDFKFNKQIHKFIGLLALLAITGFSYSIVLKTRRGEELWEVIVSALDLVTIVVPPALPAAMTIGIIYAQSRLKTSKIFCISPRSINISGCIDCVCFDKTGTLTEDNLSFNEVRPVIEEKCCFGSSFDEDVLQTNSKQIEKDNHLLLANEQYSPLMICLAACHSLTIIDQKIVGDPLDLQMFEATGWVLEEPDVGDEQKFDLLAPTVVKPPRNKRLNNPESDTYDNISEYQSSTSSSEEDLAKISESQARCSRDVGILRQFPFSSSLQRMSVITRQFSGNQYIVYTKGAPEKIASLCDSTTVPDDFTEVLHSYTNQGFRVLALAYRPLKASLSYARMQRAGRQEVEKDLKFLGLLTLGNIVKPQTISVIRTLNTASIRSVMVTGDNIQTAVSVARECGMISPQDKTILLELDNGKHTRQLQKQEQHTDISNINSSESINKSNIVQEDQPSPTSSMRTTTISEQDKIDQSRRKSLILDALQVEHQTALANTELEPILSPKILREPLRPKLFWKVISNENTKSELVEEGKDRQFKTFIEESSKTHIALTGSTWDVLLNHYPELISPVCVRGAVFARMAPDQKQQLVEQLQGLEYYVGMCGDGANDSGALRAAHTGISLSDTEASVAAPFTSSNADISCVPILIAEGRAALVTAFGILKYMALYSLTQFSAVMILYTMYTNFTDLEYLFEDLFIITSLATVFGRTGSYRSLDKKSPSNSLISIEQLSSMGIHIVLVIFFQLITLIVMWQTPWYEAHATNYDDNLAGHDNLAIFSMSCFQCISLAVVFSKGKPYRQSILSNWLLSGTVLILTTLTVLFVFSISEPFITVFYPEALIIPWEFKILLVALGFTYFIVALISERFIVEHILFKKQAKFLEIFGLTAKITKHEAIERKINASNWPQIMVKESAAYC